MLQFFCDKKEAEREHNKEGKMKLRNNISFGVKLFLLVLVMTAGILIISLISYYYNRKSGDAISDMYTESVMAIEVLGDLRTQTRANFANIMNVMITEWEDSDQEVLDNYQSRLDTIDEDLASYKNMDLDDYETSQLAVVEENMANWSQMADQILEYLDADDEDQALTLFKVSGEDTFETLQTSIKELEQYEIQTAEAQEEATQKDVARMKTVIVLISAVVIVIGLVLGFLITLSITKPIAKVIGLINTTSELNLVYDESFRELLERKDEVGKITIALADMRKRLREVVDNMTNVSTNLTSNAKELAASTEENKKTIEHISAAVHEIAEGNTQQAGSVTEVSDAISVIAEHITGVNNTGKKSSEQAKEAQNIIMQGQGSIEVTLQKMQDTITVCNDVDISITDLSAQMKKVAEIVNVIRDISAQTNLLALNASIEAARAGEAGRGFGVVATEIGQLAQDTSVAVNDISSIINDTVHKNSDTSDKVVQAKEIVDQQDTALRSTINAFDSIRTAVEKIAGQIISVSDAISNIHNLADKVSDQTQNISAVSQETAASSEEISASSAQQLSSMETIATAANGLADLAIHLNQEIDKFKM